MRASLVGVWVVVVVCVAGACSSVALEQETSGATVIHLVRHAEKAEDAGSDPPLSEVGLKRADALAAELLGAGVGRILSTPFDRTHSTATPLAAAIEVEIELMEVASLEAHIDEMATIITSDIGARFLVVGHSNTVPLLVARLGGPEFEIDETEYGDLFIVTLDQDDVQFSRSRYGDSVVNRGSGE